MEVQQALLPACICHILYLLYLWLVFGYFFFVLDLDCAGDFTSLRYGVKEGQIVWTGYRSNGCVTYLHNCHTGFLSSNNRGCKRDRGYTEFRQLSGSLSNLLLFGISPPYMTKRDRLFGQVTNQKVA